MKGAKGSDGATVLSLAPTNFPAGRSPLIQGGQLPEAPPWEPAADSASLRNHAPPFKITTSPVCPVILPAAGTFPECFPINHTRRKGLLSPTWPPYHTDEQTHAPSRAVPRKSPECTEPGVLLGL